MFKVTIRLYLITIKHQPPVQILFSMYTLLALIFILSKWFSHGPTIFSIYMFPYKNSFLHSWIPSPQHQPHSNLRADQWETIKRVGLIFNGREKKLVTCTRSPCTVVWWSQEPSWIGATIPEGLRRKTPTNFNSSRSSKVVGVMLEANNLNTENNSLLQKPQKYRCRNR